MTTIGATLAHAIALGGDGRGRFQAGATLQGWPGIVHGGGLVAVLDEAAARLGGLPGPRRLDCRLTSSVPVGTSLVLEGRAQPGTITLSLLEHGQPLTTGAVAAVDPAEGDGVRAWTGGRDGWTLPMSEHCLACGAQNPIGLRAALHFDEEGVWVRLRPREAWRAAHGALHPALAPVLLDEVAWWLGALVMKEGGLTNRIAVTLFEPSASWTGDLLAGGRFADVTAVDRRRTFWRAAPALSCEDGRLLAAASIVFRGGADYSARQMAYFRARTTPEVFRRMFPNYGGLSQGPPAPLSVPDKPLV